MTGNPEALGCVPNIGPEERRKRMRFGLVALCVGLAMAAALFASGVQRWWRLVLFPPFWVAGVGVFQARDKT
jgi:hypothetical protein